MVVTKQHETRVDRGNAEFRVIGGRRVVAGGAREDQLTHLLPYVVIMGRVRQQVARLRDAVSVWCEYRDGEGMGASESPAVVVERVADGVTVARISYNGRVWWM